MRVLLTRPRAESEVLAARLSRHGIECLIEPLLAVHDIGGAELDLGGVQALLVTSANGARALGRATPGDAAARALPVFTVGDASAAAAREAGLTHVESAGGDVVALADLVVLRLDPAAGAILHIAGSVAAGDLAGELGRAGFEVRRAVLYRAEPAASLTAAAKHALAGGKIGAVLLYSPRTAATFAALVQAAGLASACDRMEALCLSAAVADALNGLALAHVRIAPQPTEAALFALLANLPIGVRIKHVQ